MQDFMSKHGNNKLIKSIKVTVNTYKSSAVTPNPMNNSMSHINWKID